MTAVTQSHRCGVNAEYSLIVPNGRRPPQPLDPPMAPVMLAGTIGWAVAWGLLAAAGGSPAWQRTCVVGVLLGLIMLPVMAIRDRRHRSRSAPPPG